MAPSNYGPIYNNNMSFVPFLFVAFITIGSFFSISIFVAVLNLNFKESLMKNKNNLLNIE